MKTNHQPPSLFLPCACVLPQRWVDSRVVIGKQNYYSALCACCAETPPYLDGRKWCSFFFLKKWYKNVGEKMVGNLDKLPYFY